MFCDTWNTKRIAEGTNANDQLVIVEGVGVLGLEDTLAGDSLSLHIHTGAIGQVEVIRLPEHCVPHWLYDGPTHSAHNTVFWQI